MHADAVHFWWTGWRNGVCGCPGLVSFRRFTCYRLEPCKPRGPATHSDGGGLTLRVGGGGASWVFRYTSPAGKRHEMGLGATERGNSTVAGRSIVNARALAQEARAVLQRGDDPIDERDGFAPGGGLIRHLRT